MGCPKVTHVGILAILSQNEVGLRGLGLESLSTAFVRLLLLASLTKHIDLPVGYGTIKRAVYRIKVSPLSSLYHPLCRQQNAAIFLDKASFESTRNVPPGGVSYII